MVEVWKPIVNWEPFYEVSNLGRVKSMPRVLDGRSAGRHAFRITSERVMRPYFINNGYLVIDLTRECRRERWLVHRLVAFAFLTRESDLQDEVDHLDNDRSNNVSTNLEFVTRSQNHYRRYERAKKIRG